MDYLQIVNFLLMMPIFLRDKWCQNKFNYVRNDCTVVSNWPFQWKMILNLDLNTQAQEEIFGRRVKLLQSALLFNNIPLNISMFQKHFGLTLDTKLNFLEHTQNIALWFRCVYFNHFYQGQSFLTLY